MSQYTFNMWDNKSDYFLIIVSTRGTELPPPFLSTYLFSIKISLLFHLFPEFIVDNNSIYRVDTCNLLLT
jgi:hypothetical protein